MYRKNIKERLMTIVEDPQSGDAQSSDTQSSDAQSCDKARAAAELAEFNKLPNYPRCNNQYKDEKNKACIQK